MTRKSASLFPEIPTLDSGVVLNREGAPTFRRSLAEQTLQVLLTNTLSDTFYVQQKEITDETLAVLTAMRDEDPEFLAKALVYARNQGFLKLVNIVGLAVLSTATDTRWFHAAFPRVIATPDDLIDFVTVCRSGRIRKGFGGVATKAAKQWLSGLSEFHAIKYSGKSKGMSLRDVVRMTHPTPLSPDLRERLGWLVSGWQGIGEDPSPTNPAIWQYERVKRATDEAIVLDAINAGRLSWEVVVPAVSRMTPTIWEALMRQMPYMALLRHLNTFAKAGLFANPANVDYVVNWLTDEQALARAKILPFRFFDAWKAFANDPDHNAAIAAALERALEASTASMPTFAGVTAIGSDVSGSMSDTISPRGQTRYIDICAIFTAALLRKASDHTIVLPFEEDVVEDVRVSPQDTILTTADKLASIGGGGTAVGAPVQWLLDRQIKIDTFIGITDSEDWCYGPWSTSTRGSFLDMWKRYRATVAPEAEAYLVTIAPYRDAVAPEDAPGIHFVYGWSPDVVSYIASSVSGVESQVAAVRALQL